MTHKIKPVIFGEVLFDCFPDGVEVLGGAPFNVAWHLQALGDQPYFISGVGEDDLGKQIIIAMKAWGMDITSVQIDAQHCSGRVDVKLIENEPQYEITPDCAYDFIDAREVSVPEGRGILYHGTLGLRNTTSRDAFEKLAGNPEYSIFLDVNLRSPYWHKNEVSNWLQQATWVKLNHDELRQLGSATGDDQRDMSEFQEKYNLDQLILTRGEEGAMVRNREGVFFSVKPALVQQFVDTVGAGDAFTAVYLHGLIASWPLMETLNAAQQFASRVVGMRGATSSDPEFYRNFINDVVKSIQIIN